MNKILLVLLFTCLAANAQPVISIPSPLDTCDDDNDGFSVFDLTVKNDEITAGQPGLLVAYFETNGDAQANISPFTAPNSYTNISNPQTVYVRVSEIGNPSSFSLTTMTIRVFPGPFALPPPVYNLCDGPENDGIATFNLTIMDMAITDGDPAVSISYHATLADAQNGENALPNAYTTIVPWTQMVFASATNMYGCSKIVTLELKVAPVPQAVQPPDLIVYQNPQMETFNFNLLPQRDLIINGQASVAVEFYLTQADAETGTNPIPYCFSNFANPMTIYARVINLQTGCYNLTSFDLIVSSGPNPFPAVSIPDANFKAKLLQANTNNTIAKNSCGQNIKIDTNSDGEIQVDEAKWVARLDVGSSNIASLEGVLSFTNLETLNCSNNQLAELNLGGLYSLLSLECSLNQLETLDLSQTIVQYLSCSSNNLVWINLKNGTGYFVPAEFPGFWTNNPLMYVCVDEFETGAIETTMELSQLSGVTITSECAFLGIDEVAVGQNISIYPNPANDHVTVQADSDLRSITVFDIQGRNVHAYSPQATAFSFDISKFENGIYFLKIVTDKGMKTEKVIKK
jgi:hypothetical protein